MKRLILTILVISAVALFASTAVGSKCGMKCGKCLQQVVADSAEGPAADAAADQPGCRGMQKGKANCKGGEDCKCENCGKQGKKMNCKGGKDCPKEGCDKKMNCKGGKDCPKESCGKKMKCRGGETCEKENCGKQGKKMNCKGKKDCPGNQDCPKQS